MSKIVKLKSTGTGYSLIVGGETVKTGLPSVSLALRWLRNNYGRKFQESLVSSTAKDGSRLVGRKNPKKRKPSKRRNMSQGITRGTGPTRVFHPIRSAPDYDPSLLRDSEGKKARSGLKAIAKKRKATKAKGLKAIKSKSTVKAKTATKKRKAKKAVSLFGKKALPTSRRKNSVKAKGKKRAIPAAFKAAAERAKAMTPAQRAAWAKKMQAARKAKQKLKR